MGFYGMDVEQGETFAQTIADRRTDLSDLAQELGSRINGLADAWRGPDYDRFRESWATLESSQISTAIDRLMELARSLHEHVEDQNVASAAGGLDSFLAHLDDWFGDIFQGDGFSWRNLLPNPNDVEDVIGMGLNALLDGLGGAYQGLAVRLSQVAPVLVALSDDMARAGSLVNKAIMKASSASRLLGGVGAVVTAGFAGWDRWEQDASDPSLSTGERITRAAIDGGANAAGGLGGAAGGAAIGTAICPGVGTVIGGIVGGALGSGLANGLVDWALG